MAVRVTRRRYTEEDRQRVHELAAQGLGYRRIARETGVGQTTTFGWLHPEYAKKARVASAAAKRRRTGTCQNCGATTSYNGRHGQAVSDICHPCSARATGEERRGKGPMMEAVLALLATGDEVRFIELRDAVVAAGGQPLGINALLYQRLMPRGFARRVARGLYVAGPALTNGKPT